MASLMKASSFLVNRGGDSKPSLLKWRRNPLLRTTQISLPPSMMMMIKNNSTATSGLIRTIKCSSSSSSSRRSALRVQCVMNTNNNNNSSSKNNCFKKEEQVKEEDIKERYPKQIPFRIFLKLMLKALTTPLVAAIFVGVLLKNYPALASSRTPIFFAAMLAYDLCRAIVSRRRVDDSYIDFSMGPALGTIWLFITAVALMVVGLESESSSETNIEFMAMMFMLVIVMGSGAWPTPPST